ncbi:hypothetical protein [Micromonospora sp. LOL_024]|uniref:hypothetical protein n=1 Tax=Micromonospora sp. LOL_024 TaxID=3345412 RepID=UPI003A88680A
MHSSRGTEAIGAARDAVHRDGYAVLPDYLPPVWNDRLVAGLDRLAETHPESKALIPHEPFLELLCTDLVQAPVAAVLGGSYLFHHANGKRITDGAGKVWHHDFDSDETWDGSAATMMMHVMVYPAGLSAEKGPLVLRPGSHLVGVPRHHPNRQGYEIRSDDLVLTGDPGLVVLVNSAMWHMRPPSDAHGPRHYLNLSFIGPARTVRPERDTYGDLISTLPSLVDVADRDRVAMLCRPHR